MIYRASAVIFALLIYNLVFFPLPFLLPGTIGSLALVFACLIFITIAFLPKLSPPKPWPLATMGLALVAASLALTRANFLDRTLLTLESLSLCVLSLYLLAANTASLSFLCELIYIPFKLTFTWIFQSTLFVFNHLPKSATKFLTTSKHSSTAQTTAIIRGLIITVPISFIIILLLSSDLAFNHLLTQLFHLDLTVPQRLTYSALLTFIITPITFLKLNKPTHSPLNQPQNAHYTTEATILTTTIVFILGLFLIIQFPYLFTTVSETKLHQFGVQTYSEYVRRGFVELSLVSLITYSVVGISYTVLRSLTNVEALTQRKSVKPLLILNLLLLSQTAIFILSIFRRLYLYSTSHGLTLIRIYGSVFLIMMIALTLILALRHLYKHRFHYFHFELATLLAATMIPTFINPERLILAYPPTVNQETDYVYLARLSADGIDGWISAYDHVTSWLDQRPQILQANELNAPDLRQIRYHQMTINSLQENYYYLALRNTQPETALIIKPTFFTPPDLNNLTSNTRFYSTNLSERSAYQRLSNHINPQTLVTLNQSLIDLINRSTPANQPRPPLDRSLNSPLVR